MLRGVLRDLLSRRGPDGELERLAAQVRAHRRAPVAEHARILFAAARVGGRPLLELVADALHRADSATPPEKALRRPASLSHLIDYFRHARRIPGAWAECGVFTGVSASALCLAARAEEPGFTGAGLHLVDSFEGLGPRSPEDEAEGPAKAKGDFAAPEAVARAALADFPEVVFHRGWIPGVLDQLPESAWSFVHIDVDLYEATLAALEYFFPRLAAGGVIVCDDYGAPTFPGARRAWERFFGPRDAGYVVLPTGQSVFLKVGPGA